MVIEYIYHPMGTGVPMQGALFPALLIFSFVIMSWCLPMMSSAGMPSLIDHQDQCVWIADEASCPYFIWALDKISPGMLYALWVI